MAVKASIGYRYKLLMGMFVQSSGCCLYHAEQVWEKDNLAQLGGVKLGFLALKWDLQQVSD